MLPPSRHSVFVDTSGWFALVVQRDVNHVRAVGIFNALAASRRRLVVTNYIVAESYTLLRVRRGVEAALGFLRRIRATATVTTVRVEVAWEQAAEELLHRYHDRELSYTDATSFTAMRELGLQDVLTFDTDFSIAGFQPL
ncbi:MAG: type II toxin-antitoxin system VapC family toxin [Chloroflexota bacterium]